MITVYGKPFCGQCDNTTRDMDALGITYTKVDLTKDVAALDMVMGLGHRQAPVVVAGDDHWSGYQPKKIAALPR